MREILAYHIIFGCHGIIFGCHGFWLPNDPRGSGSDDVRSKPLQKFGKPTKVETRESVAHVPHDVAKRLAAKDALKYLPVELTGLQALSVSRGFAEQIRTSGVVVWACAIMPDHVHLVVREHRYNIEQVVRLLKQAATRTLLADERHPFANQRLKSRRLPSVWQQDFRKIFLFSAQDILTRIQYVNNNPIEAGYKAQHWSFIAPFEIL